MRKRFALSFLSVLLLSFTNLKAQVYNGDLTLATQTQVDAFNYTEVTGNLIISELTAGNITNLNGLSELISVGGNVRIIKNDLLGASGLPNLATIGEDLVLFGNNSLVDIEGINNLTSIGGDLSITNNSALLNISGLNALTSIAVFDIADNNTLAHIDGFNDLLSIGGELLISSTTLIDVTGFTQLTSVGGNLRIIKNDLLTDIALPNLAIVGGDLDFFGNNALTNIGLSNLSSIGGTLLIKGNSSLADINGINNLTSIGGDLSITNNSALLNIGGLNALTSIAVFDIADNVALAHIDGFNGLLSIGGELLISSPALIDVAGFTQLTSVGGNVRFIKNFLLTGSVLPDLVTVGGDLVFFSNHSLTNIELNSISSIGGTLNISENDSLVDIEGINNLASIGEDLSIRHNPDLINLNGLQKLISVGGNLYITENEKLANFCGLYALLFNDGLSGTYNVSGNAVNPAIADIITVGGQAPVITDVSASSIMLAPPNHKLRDITINYNATSACGPVKVTLSVGSNEPINGTGDGDTSPDWIIVDDHHVKLRAERAANGNGRIYTIIITATNLTGVSSSKAVEVRVAHNITDPHSGKAFIVNSTVNFSGEFWDKPTNKHTAKWLIDDNTSVKGIVTEPTANKNGKVTGSYKFTSPGVYKLQMNTIDQNNITSYSNTNGDLEAIVVIYDPNGGNTYGGGYFNSPAGALKSNQTATGKASYGFAMNYFRNSTNPKGETQFEFKVGEFEFNALNFDYLVISNSMAQFKGTGKIIGGQSGVGFTMTVVDGQLDGTGVDKIRMKIFNKSNGTIIYDNQPGASDAVLPTHAVGANSSIVISGNNNSNITRSTTTQKAEMETTEPEVSNVLDVIAYPNPSTNNFSITVHGNSKEKITLLVVDMYGRTIDSRNVSANSIIRFGERYSAGTYFVRITQGKEQKEIKLIKL